MNKLEHTILSLANTQLSGLRHLIATPRDTDEDRAMAARFEITADDLRNNEIANKMIEIKTLTQLAMIDDSGLGDEGLKRLRDIERECDSLMRTHAWIFG